MEEQVFAIPTNKLWDLLTYTDKGFINKKTGILDTIIKQGLFEKRDELETDPSFKQLIPYGVLSNEESYYLFERTSGQTEKRLHRKLSLGVGGHMNPVAENRLDEQYAFNELIRELTEEVDISENCQIQEIEFIGFINDDTIPVGKVHIGLLFHIRLSSKDISIRETEKMNGRWVDKKDLANNLDVLETWSAIAFKNIS